VADNKLWGGRFSSEQDPVFARFNDSLPFDHVLIEEDIEGSIAYAEGLERAGVLSSQERTQVDAGLRAVLEDWRRNPGIIALSRAEDVHSYVEQALTAKVGSLALKLHTGRSRNDQVATDLRLYVAKKERAIERQLDQLLSTIASVAQSHPSEILPGYTHLQRAQPVLFAHYLLAYGEMFLRDRQRLRQAAARTSVCPLGSGALSGTVYGVDRAELAKRLGFAAYSENSMDAVSDRDFVLDFLFFASTLLVHLSRLAEDLILYSSSEFAFVQIDDSVTSGSSLMPQKKNPDALELIRGKSGRVFGQLMSMLTVLKGLPMTYNKDLQEDKEGLFDAISTVELCLAMADRVLQRMSLNAEQMTRATEKGFLNATELADYLVSKGMPFREAHHLVGKLVVRATELNITLEQLPIREFQTFSPLFSDDLYRCLNIEVGVNRRKTPGGTAAETVTAALKKFGQRIDD
jgi:argininosuccinate lyase